MPQSMLHDITQIDIWFIDKIAILVGMENALKNRKLTKELLLEAKRMEFPDYIIARLTGKTEDEIKGLRSEYGIKAAYKMVDTCAAEFEMCIRDSDYSDDYSDDYSSDYSDNDYSDDGFEDGSEY